MKRGVWSSENKLSPFQLHTPHSTLLTPHSSLLKSSSHAAAHTASAAHHGLRNGIDLLTVNDDRAAVILCRTVIVEGRHLSGNVNGTSVYNDIAVSVNGVGIALSHDDGQITVVNFNRRCGIGTALISGIDTVIRSGNIDRAAVNAYIRNC